MIAVRQITHQEREYWDSHVLQYEACSPFNAYAWGLVRSTDGWEPLYLVAERSGRFCGAIMVLMKRLPATPFSVFYSPRGPLLDWSDREALQALIEKVREQATARKAIFLRSDPNVPEGSAGPITESLASIGYVHLNERWTFWNSPRDVSRIDLTRVSSAEELFNLLDRDTRRCIRKAGREGVTIETAKTEEELKSFYNIFKDFSVTKGFMARDYDYQKMVWDTFILSDLGKLFVAKYRGEIIGGLMCIMFGRKCIAMHMGTPYKYQKLQSYYTYVWESIKWAKEQGCSYYSFRGVGTTPSQEYFKRKFLPEVISLCGYYDLPFRPTLYKVWRFGEFSLVPKLWPALIYGRKLLSNLQPVYRRSLDRLAGRQLHHSLP